MPSIRWVARWSACGRTISTWLRSGRLRHWAPRKTASSGITRSAATSQRATRFSTAYLPANGTTLSDTWSCGWLGMAPRRPEEHGVCFGSHLSPASRPSFVVARLAFSANSHSICAMFTTKIWLFIALGGFAAFYLITWLSAIRQRRDGESIALGPIQAGIGFVTNFFDTLGIGSFATTTKFYKLRNLVKDEIIPGTLNVGHTLPTIAQAFIYIAIVNVD